MSRKNWYFSLLITALVVIAVGFILHIPFIMRTTRSIAKMVVDWRLVVPAVVCALVLTKHKSYWLIMLGCAVVTAVVIQLYFYHLHGLRPLLLRTAAFMTVAYAVDYARLLLRR